MTKKPKPRRRPERWLSMVELRDRWLADPRLASKIANRARRDQLAYIRREVRKVEELDAEGRRLTKMHRRKLWVSSAVLEEWIPANGDAPDGHEELIALLFSRVRELEEKQDFIYDLLEPFFMQLKQFKRV